MLLASVVVLVRVDGILSCCTCLLGYPYIYVQFVTTAFWVVGSRSWRLRRWSIA